MTWIFIVASFIGTSLSAPVSNIHDIHLSKCQIKYSQKSSSLQITLHVFLDDLETALGDEGGTWLKLFTEKENVEADSLIVEYLNQHLRLETAGVNVAYEYLGKEISDDLIGMWCYLEIYELENVDEVDILYNVFQELYDDQINILTLSDRAGELDYMTFTDSEQREHWKL